jgi:gag-polypeptide of LTR copia-type/Zinc knuckle
MPENQFEKLNEKNYVDWRYMMEALLVEKDLWDVVDGTEGRPAGSDNSKAVRAYVKKQQVARAKIILHIEPSQLPHARFSDPTEIWENLEQVHRARGFATRLALRREFLYMKKRDGQVMNSWIAEVKNTAYRLDAAGVAVIDEDIILTLTAGLPESYSTLIVTLDNLSPNDLTLPNVITRLLNEEVRQNAHEDVVELSGPVYSVQDAKNKKIKPPLSEITCYNCGKKGHYKSTCPVLKKESETGDKVVASLF